MRRWANDYKKLLSAESLERFVIFQKDPGKLDDNEELRGALLDFIADFSNWDNSAVTEYLETSRALTHVAHEALGGVSSSRPLVVDPFCGGGAIPLEAVRVGADAFASDLNPLPILLNKVILEYVPKYGSKLAEQVKCSGNSLRAQLEAALTKYYFTKEVTPQRLVFFWARTITCEGPGCGYVFPLLRSLWLRQKTTKGIALVLRKIEKTKQIDIEIASLTSGQAVGAGTSKQGSATCPACGYTTPVERVRNQLSERRGGAADAKLLAVAVKEVGLSGKSYRLPSEDELRQFASAVEQYLRLKRSSEDGISTIPCEELNHLRGFFNVVLYGMRNWGDLFSPRQTLLMTTITRLIREEHTRLTQTDSGLADAVSTCLALAAGKVAQYNSSCCRWKPTGETLVDMFGRQAIPMVWDFAEAFPFSGSTGDWQLYIDAVCAVLENLANVHTVPATVQQSSATVHPLPNDAADAFITDPPYYDAIPYADLSDFFYVWLRRMLGNVHPQLLADSLSPKTDECVTLAHRAAMYRNKDRHFFERMMTLAMAEGRRYTKTAGIGVVVFANKSTSGWEAMLSALIQSGWIVTASWPIDTEMSSRLRAQDSAVLASSVHLVCRPRADIESEGNKIGDWRDVLQELPQRIHKWMSRLSEEGVVGADAIFACIGPALEIFSRYSSVEKASGQTVALREYLEQVWAAVAKEALAMVFKGADASGFEEDARLTAMWLWTLFAGRSGANGLDDEADEEDEAEESASKQKGYVLEYDAARKIAQGLGAHLESLPSLVEIKGETATLLSVAERTRRLFGREDAASPTKAQKKKKAQLQLGFVSELEQAEEAGSWGSKGVPPQGVTVLDRVHQSMILFAAGRAEALRRFLVDEGVGRDERFWRLAQVLSYLYPSASEERRWIDGVLARKKGLGL